jgi:hypothetical protein
MRAYIHCRPGDGGPAPLRHLNFLRDPPDGLYGPPRGQPSSTTSAPPAFAQTGEPSKALFESLKETREKAMRKPN